MRVEDFMIRPSYQVMGLAMWESVAFGLCLLSGQVQGPLAVAAPLLPMTLVLAANWLRSRGW